MKRNFRLSRRQSNDARQRGLRRFRYESLEQRLLLAADTFQTDPMAEIHGVLIGAIDNSGQVIASSDSMLAEGESAEGEPVLDLVAVAKELAKVGTKFYGADWCPACNSQKQLFSDGAQFLPFIEVTNPDRSLNQIGIDNQIGGFPTWEFPDGSREVGVVSVETLLQRSLIAEITSETPSIAPIDDVTVLSGAPLHLALDAYDPDGDAIDFTVSVTPISGDVNLETFIPEDNTSLLFSVAGFGDFTIELFEGRVPVPAGQIRQLAEQGFYDGLTFHRVIEDFMIQTGSPNGDGTGGSALPNIDDQFHVDLQHTSAGDVSYAKGGDDTGNSQLFITAGETRFLDFNHAVFGHVKEGDASRRAIARTAVEANPSGEVSQPIRPVVINSVTAFEDTEDAVLMLKAPEGESGTAEVTVTATDADGNSTSDTFTVTITPDTSNGGPFLDPMSTVFGEANSPIEFQLPSTDIEGDSVFFDAVRNGTVPYTFEIDNQTGIVTIDPPEDFVGDLTMLVGVRALQGSDTGDTFDTQIIDVTVLPSKPTVDLVAAKDTGSSSVDNITNLNNSSQNNALEFLVSGGLTGADIQVFAGDTLIGTGTAASDVLVTTDGLAALSDGEHQITATQELNGLVSPASNPINLFIDTQVGAFTSTPPLGSVAGQPLAHNVDSAEEGVVGFAYSLANAPDGVTIDATTGLLEWTPTLAQIGQNQFQVIATDAAGNTLAQDFDLDVVADALVLFRIFPTDLDGNEITQVNAGEEFLLQVNVRDISVERNGVFAGYLDVETVQGLISFTGPVIPGEEFPNTVTGGFSNPTEADEVGAIAGFQPTGSSELHLVSIRARADLAGTETFVADPADSLPASHVLLFDNQVAAVPTNQIIFGTSSLEILPTAGANDDIFNFDEDSSNHVLDVLVNDNAGSGQDIVISAVGATSRGGDVTIDSDGKGLTYTPAADVFGVETFTYTIDDGAGEDTATVTVQLQPINDVPTGIDDDLQVNQNSAANVLDVLQNDVIAPDENEQLEITNVTSSQIAADISIGAGGANLIYTPPFGFIGSDEFVYTFNDGNGGVSQAVVQVEIDQVNDAPVAVTDEVQIDEDSANQTIDVLANDTTESGEQLTITGLGSTDKGGVVSINGSVLNYTPAANFFGTETFSYTIDDGNGGTATGTVEVDVRNVNDPPVANDDQLNSSRDISQQTLNVLNNDSTLPDDAAESLTIVAVGASNVGATVDIGSDGQTLVYTPPAGFVGNDTFTYTVEDSEGESSTATANVNVREFQPSSISGFVYFDVNNNGVFESRERPIGGVVVSLVGTDVFGDTVQLQQTTVANGRYEFANLLPGNYVIVETQPAFLLDGQDTLGNAGGSAAVSDQFTLDLEQGTTARGYNFGERGREARFIGIESLFALRANTGVLAATEPGSGQRWYSFMDGWNDFSSANVTISADLQTLDVEVRDEQDNPMSLRLGTGRTRSAHVLGNSGNLQFVEIVGSAASFNFETPNGNGGGESEPANVAAPAAPNVAAPNVPAPNVPVPAVPVTPPANHNANGEGEDSTAALQAAQVPVRTVSNEQRDLLLAAISTTDGQTSDDVFASLLTTRLDVGESLPSSSFVGQSPLVEHLRVNDRAIEMFVGTGSSVRRLPDLLDRDVDLDALLPAESERDGAADATTESTATDSVMSEEDSSLEDLLVSHLDSEIAELAVDQIFES